jgi:hypothetical protein
LVAKLAAASGHATDPVQQAAFINFGAINNTAGVMA